MSKWVLIFTVMAVVAGVVGYGGAAGAMADVAQFVFFACMTVGLVLFGIGLFVDRENT